MNHLDFEGKNTEEAIAKACATLNLPMEEIKFSILTTGSSGIFGLGSRKAKIRVELPAESAPKTEVQPAAEDSKPQAKPTSPVEASKPQAKPTPPADRPVKSSISVREDHERPVAAPDNGGAGGLELNLESLELPLAPTQPAPGETIHEGEPDEFMRIAMETAGRLLELMGFEAQVKPARFGDRVILNISTQAHGLLIGKKGATLDALQFVINKITPRIEAEGGQIILDIEDYRSRRHEAILELAKNIAEKAWRLGRPVTINQLSASERRIVHLFLKGTPVLRTKSRGDGLFKSLVIIPLNRDKSAFSNEAELVVDSLDEDDE